MKKYLVIVAVILLPQISLACTTSSEEVVKFFKESDADSDGYLSEDEYTALVEKKINLFYEKGQPSLLEAGPRKKAAKIISVTDSDKDGKIILKEFKPLEGQYWVPKCV